MTEVAPHVHQAQPGELAGGVLRGDELQIGIDELGQDVGPPVVEVRARLPKPVSELPPIAHEREDRDVAPLVQALALFASELRQRQRGEYSTGDCPVGQGAAPLDLSFHCKIVARSACLRHDKGGGEQHALDPLTHAVWVL